MGTRIVAVIIYSLLEDHPHACGDKKLSYRFQKKGVGSSPRVWGQVFFKSVKHHLTGIIPTRVGTRSGIVTALKSIEDHPHACGDKLVLIYGISLIIGSSPRVWGQDSVIGNLYCSIRIIPTRVGTSDNGQQK